MINRMMKKVFCYIMIVAFCFLSFKNSGVRVEAKRQKSSDFKKYSQKEAKSIGKKQVSALIKNKGEIASDIKIKAERSQFIYNAEKELCAYAFDIKKNGEDSGYVVVGANEEYPPIIEYALTGRFLDNSVCLNGGEYLIYDGGVNYYKAKNEESVAKNIHTKKEVELEELKKERRMRTVDHSSEWDAINSATLEDKAEINEVNVSETDKDEEPMKEEINLTGNGASLYRYSRDSNVDTAVYPLTDPGKYESNYISRSSSQVYCYSYANYLDMYKINGYSHYCVSLAATNLLMYWHERKFYNLMYGGSWENSFLALHNFMGGNSAIKSLEDVPRALERYLNIFGITNANIRYHEYMDFYTANGKNHDRTQDAVWDFMKEEIRGGAPFLFTPHMHCYYSDNTSDHALLALGYQEFKYKNIQESTGRNYSGYLLVEDGWSSQPNRYVNFTVGSEWLYSSFVTLYFIGK